MSAMGVPNARTEPAYGPPAPGQRWHELDVIRGAAVLAVVVYHAIVAVDVLINSPPAWLLALNDACSPFRMPVMMFLSGLLLPRSLDKPRRIYLAGKLRGIAWPYVVWTAMMLGFFAAGAARERRLLTAERVWVILTSPSTFTWYLAYLFAYYLLALVVPPILRVAAIPVLIIASGFIDEEWLVRFVFLLGMFFAGEWVARHPGFWAGVRNRPTILVAATVALLVMVSSGSGESGRYSAVSSLGVAGLIIAGMPISRRIRDTTAGRLLRSIGHDSLVYYVTHWIPIAICVQIMATVSEFHPTLAVVVATGVGLGVSATALKLRACSRMVARLYAWPERKPLIHPSGELTDGSGAGDVKDSDGYPLRP